MPKHGSRNVLTVFIGSPGDVAKEREIAREVADEANKILRGIGWEIDLRGWEDTLPGHGRPQEIINTDVRECHLFLGLLHARWGTPTGTHSSGFEEEFRLAMALRKEFRLPEIWLFFKRVSEEQLGDPGDQLSKVLAFRKEIEQGREILFKDIKSSGEWRSLQLSMLLQYVLKQNHDLQTSSDFTHAAQTMEESGGGVAAPCEPMDSSKVPPQLSEALVLAEKGVDEELSEFQAARIHLYSTAALARYHQVPLGVHETNLLYRHRTILDALQSELQLLFSTVVGDPGNVIPGWYWLSKNSLAATTRMLFSLALFAQSEEVRTRATTLLADAEISPTTEDLPREGLVERLLKDSSEQSRLAKIEYIASVGVRGDLPALDRVAEKATGTVRAKAEQARTRILIREDPARIVAELLEKRHVFTTEVKEELEHVAKRIPSQTLEAVTHSEDASVRLFAIQQLATRREISETLARTLVTDSSKEIKTVGVKELLNAGKWTESDEMDIGVRLTLRTLIVKRMAKAPMESLKNKIGWFSVSGTEAYEALAIFHFDAFAEQVRRDLSDGFETLRQEGIKQVRSWAPKAEEYLKEIEYFESYAREVFTAAALGALAKFGEPRDVVFARRYLDIDQTEVRRVAIKLLERFGDESDCSRLIDLAKNQWSTRQEATRAALTISSRSSSVLRTLFDSGEPSLVAIALTTLMKEDLPTFLPDLRSLSLHDSNSVRISAVACLQRLAIQKDLEQFLEWYLTERPYYYDVVCWLDRVLFAPEPLRRAFERTLQTPYDADFDSVLETD